MLQDRGKEAVLVLENGSLYRGYFFGFEGETTGEVCFNTSMAGYQEILTDPSYSRQIVTLTYPMIGNYGINSEFNQSAKIQAAGLIVKEYVDHPSNFMSRNSLAESLKKEKIVAIEGLDTRKLVLQIRTQGAQRGGIFPGPYEPSMLDRVRSSPEMKGQDLASVVSAEKPYRFGDAKDKKYRLAVMDFGIKTGILKNLDQCGFDIEVFPAKTEAKDILEKKFDCYFLSNGPGDPEPLDYAVKTIQALLKENKPMFGICLGHQLLGLSSDGKTYKLKFGHRGGNQPVKDLRTGRVEITAQNHGFAVENSEKGMALSHINLNDKTVEGFYDENKNILSIQYHPEACPGPNDSVHLFQDFYEMVDAFYQKK